MLYCMAKCMRNFTKSWAHATLWSHFQATGPYFQANFDNEPTLEPTFSDPNAYKLWLGTVLRQLRSPYQGTLRQQDLPFQPNCSLQLHLLPFLSKFSFEKLSHSSQNFPEKRVGSQKLDPPQGWSSQNRQILAAMLRLFFLQIYGLQLIAAMQKLLKVWPIFLLNGISLLLPSTWESYLTR